MQMTRFLYSCNMLPCSFIVFLSYIVSVKSSGETTASPSSDLGKRVHNFGFYQNTPYILSLLRVYAAAVLLTYVKQITTLNLEFKNINVHYKASRYSLQLLNILMQRDHVRQYLTFFILLQKNQRGYTNCEKSGYYQLLQCPQYLVFSKQIPRDVVLMYSPSHRFYSNGYDDVS